MVTTTNQPILEQIVAGLARRRLTTPARIVLDVVAPLGFLAAQAALFARPLLPLGRWRDYVGALSDEQSWLLLRELVEKQPDC